MGRTGLQGVVKDLSASAHHVPHRELDEVLGLTEMAGALLHDWLTGQNTRHTMVGLHRATPPSGPPRWAPPRPPNAAAAIIGPDVGLRNSNIEVGASGGGSTMQVGWVPGVTGQGHLGDHGRNHMLPAWGV